MNQITKPPGNDAIWGARAIAKFLGLSESRVYELSRGNETAAAATAVVISALPYIARRMWRERTGDVVALQTNRRQA